MSQIDCFSKDDLWIVRPTVDIDFASLVDRIFEMAAVRPRHCRTLGPSKWEGCSLTRCMPSHASLHVTRSRTGYRGCNCLEKGAREWKATGLKEALQAYQDTRQPRTSRIQKAGTLLQLTYHLIDGDEQARRDGVIAQDVEDKPIIWGSSARRKWLFGYDADLIAK